MAATSERSEGSDKATTEHGDTTERSEGDKDIKSKKGRIETHALGANVSCSGEP